ARADGMQQTFSVHCQPEASAVAALAVRLAPRPIGAVVWRMGGDEGRELPAVLETRSPAAGESSGDEAVYRLLLPRPRASAFAVLGECSAPGTDHRVTLAWLPEANTQSGQVEIHSADGSRLAIQADEVQPLPPSAAVNDRFTTLRARYHYDAGRRAKI